MNTKYYLFPNRLHQLGRPFFLHLLLGALVFCFLTGTVQAQTGEYLNFDGVDDAITATQQTTVKYPGLKARGLSLKQKFRDHRPIDVDPIT